MSIRKSILIYFTVVIALLTGLTFLFIYVSFSQYREEQFQERQKEKEQRRQESKARKASSGPRQTGDEDPDIAGIIPGPQKPLWEDEDEETKENEVE